MRWDIFIAVMAFTLTVSAQDTLEFQKCLDDAVAFSPRLKDKQMINEEGRLTIANVQRGLYPELTMNGRASYQSDVVTLSIDQPGFTLEFPEIPHSQFGLNLDIRQTLYDGGLTRHRKYYEQAVTEAAIKNVEIDLYAFREQVAEIFFNILLLQDRLTNLEIALVNLEARENVLQSAVDHGIAETTDLQVIRVEILKMRQQYSALNANRQGALEMLAVYLGEELNDNVILEIPSLESAIPEDLKRPELEWITLQSRVLEAGKELSDVKRRPRVFAFSQAGVGMPGYNMLNDQVDSYYMVGAGIQWKIWDWNNVRREKQMLQTKQQVLNHSMETFSMNIIAAMKSELRQEEHYRNSMEMDDKIVRMRVDITEKAASRLENGVISAVDYLQVLNEEHLARNQRSTHHLQLLKANINYRILTGTL
ncbi:MAG: TolC family protein [Bacteroidales bacterium]